ncbi:hypothetical protein B0H17DRAFT_1078686 [Mycena rosella]|uniref:Uncharacterized protein n=1 Tax=Mycena rosella TaxID=1033263 RepID=A0AAD7D4D2_MYCRO|nr:hypothetical protein B0H17DRAFT_1078686 [Mycena rosella]
MAFEFSSLQPRPPFRVLDEMSFAETELQPVFTWAISGQNPDSVEDGEIVEPSPASLEPSRPGAHTETETVLSDSIDSRHEFMSEQPSPPSSVTVSSPRIPPVSYSMTAEELDLAKDIVLDLLGWGVDAEYLLDCGVSAVLIHRIFTDLRLRLPRNLSVDIDPWTP